MKRYLVPVIAGVTVFGAVSAFAASMTLSSTSLGSGDAVVAACNGTAAVTYTTSYEATSKRYKVATAPITTGTGTTCATQAYKVTLTGAAGVLQEVTGTLGADGKAAPAFTTVFASDVTGVSVVITG